MPELSEFIGFVTEKSDVSSYGLVEKDILIHGILKELSSAFGEKYAFKGGSCLVKCYLGYYRFSVELDFTWIDQKAWGGLGSKRLRRELLKETEKLSVFLESVAGKLGLNFKNDVGDRNYIEFGGGNRMVTFKLWKNSEIMKVQINFVESILFGYESVFANTLIGSGIKAEDLVYFEDFFKYYSPFKVNAYRMEEILCEKVRAILTRRAQKLRDFYDIFMLERQGINVKDFKQEIADKVRTAMYFQKYKNNLEENIGNLEIEEIFDDPFENRNVYT